MEGSVRVDVTTRREKGTIVECRRIKCAVTCVYADKLGWVIDTHIHRDIHLN